MQDTSRKSGDRLDMPVLLGYLVSAIWAIAIGAYFLFVPNAAGSLAATGAGKFIIALSASLPFALIWFAVFVALALQNIRQENARIQATLARIGKTAEAAAKAPAVAHDPAVVSQLEEIATLTRQTETRVTELTEKALASSDKPTGPRDTAALPPSNGRKKEAEAQQALPLAGSKKPQRMPITVRELIRALNFPETAEDKEGFRVMRRALEERRLSKLILLAQDLLTAFSQDGIYMDDLTPDLPMARVWRRFAAGERGITISALGGVRDRSAITLTKTRMKSDAAFRENAHNFLREFDKVLREFEKIADDEELNTMANTRTSRAFMLLGRVAGTFD